ncbi:hypothetical protein F7725_023733 [Dissostichus mawsoni]|uniref:Uncharacterized protein n=1 Tax=Dissostichus mawsoni TaxID=36200 RepID=A0A7J5XXG4_DISMA|nr:hypothetical protein F7725_023733 [Dissostichus mawsoni]
MQDEGGQVAAVNQPAESRSSAHIVNIHRVLHRGHRQQRARVGEEERNSPFFIPTASISPSALKLTQRAAAPTHTLFNTPNATDSMVCMRASSTVPTTPFLYIRAPPASVQNFTCLIPTDTNCESESGRNSTTKIRSGCPALLHTLDPAERHMRHTVMVCSGSTPTDSSSFPVALKFTECVTGAEAVHDGGGGRVINDVCAVVQVVKVITTIESSKTKHVLQNQVLQQSSIAISKHWKE